MPHDIHGCAICVAVKEVKIFPRTELNQDPSCPRSLKSLDGSPAIPGESFGVEVLLEWDLCLGGYGCHELGEPTI